MRGKDKAVKDKGKKLDKKSSKGKGSASKSKQNMAKDRKKMRYHPGTVALREIKKYQKYDKPLTARFPFERKVRNLIKEINPDLRLKQLTLECMREATEAYLVDVLGDSNLCAIHANRQTVMQKDVVLAKKIRGDLNRGYY